MLFSQRVLKQLLWENLTDSFYLTSNKMFVCGLSAVVFEDNYFGKSLLINFSNTCNSLSSKAINSSQAKSLETDEAVEVFNVTENKINSITDFFYLKHYLDLWLLQL